MKESITRQIPTINEKQFLFGEQNLCDTVAQYNIQRGYDSEKAQYKAEATFSRICFLNEINDNLPKGVELISKPSVDKSKYMQTQ